ncbi:MAG: O-antigen ligase family protein [Kiritimatiellae bacterium]|nr:O-antigen ligase family protein [Kiritimatiellia bacterium]
MDALIRHVPVLLVFLTLSAAAWLHGGTRTEAMLPVIPWLWALLFETLLFFPQRRPFEDPVSARRRAMRGLGRDPLLYVTLAFVLILAIPFLNRGLCPVCDYPAIMKGRSPDPSIPFAPFCVDIPEHFNVVMWFVPALTAMLAARHALSRSGKRLLMEMLVWNAVALAMLGFIQQATDAKAPLWVDSAAKGLFFSSFGYVNMGGAYFAMMFAFSVGVWLTRVADVAGMPPIDPGKSVAQQLIHRFIRAHYPLVAAAINMYAVLATLCRAAMLSLIVLAAFAFLYYECSLFFARSNRAKNIKKGAFGLAGGAIIVISMFIFGPTHWTNELKTVSSHAVLDRVSGKAQYHSRVAAAILRDYPLFGAGGWGYRHLCTKYMTNDELKQLQTLGGANVHNDYLQFLCEHGTVGFGFLVLAFVLLVSPIFREWFKLYRAARFMRTAAAPPSPRALYCLPPGTLWILLGNAALLVCASGDCPMRSLAVLSAFFVSLACADGYLPRDHGGGR